MLTYTLKNTFSQYCFVCRNVLLLVVKLLSVGRGRAMKIL